MPPRSANPVAQPFEAFVMVALCFGPAIVTAASIAADDFRNEAFTDARLLRLGVEELILAGIASLILRRRGWSLRELLPRPSWSGSFVGLLLAFVCMWASWLSMLPFYDPGMLEPLKDLMGRERPLLGVVLLTSIVNGLYEEVFLLSYLLNGLRHRGLSFALGCSLLVRMSYHIYQGPLGAVSVLAFGVVLSVHYIRTGDLWPAAFAHIFWDIAAFT